MTGLGSFDDSTSEFWICWRRDNWDHAHYLSSHSLQNV